MEILKDLNQNSESKINIEDSDAIIDPKNENVLDKAGNSDVDSFVDAKNSDGNINRLDTDSSVDSFVDAKNSDDNTIKLNVDSFVDAKDGSSSITNKLIADSFVNSNNANKLNNNVDAKEGSENTNKSNLNNNNNLVDDNVEVELDSRSILIAEANEFKRENQLLIEELEKLKNIISSNKKEHWNISKEKRSLQDQVKRLNKIIEKDTQTIKKSEGTIQQLNSDNDSLNERIKTLTEAYETFKKLYEQQKAKNQNDILTKEIIKGLNKEKQSDRKRCIPFTENKRRRMELAKRLKKENNNLENTPKELITIKSEKKKVNPLESSIQKEIDLLPEIKPVNFIGHVYNLLGYTVTTTSVLLSLLFSRDYLNAQRFVDKNRQVYLNEAKEIPTPGQLVNNKLTNTLVSSIALLFLLNILYCKGRNTESNENEDNKQKDEKNKSNSNLEEELPEIPKIELLDENSFIIDPNKDTDNHTGFNDKSISMIEIIEDVNDSMNRQYSLLDQILPEDHLNDVKKSLEDIKFKIGEQEKEDTEKENTEKENTEKENTEKENTKKEGAEKEDAESKDHSKINESKNSILMDELKVGNGNPNIEIKSLIDVVEFEDNITELKED
ncbi:hypothetical protein H8356DRAFT_1633425 [Neocallimastix lanati (nom. inval.)]|nr:hypothetical protein H8356DRAFT_1633425 [Neocallimastix sp. JGI-2020a]